ncbi:MAG: LacI family DNA-binding transcriptional regulator, partial [Victivallales bacterium]
MNQMEIARKLKISQTTVSLVLNNPSTTKVSQGKRQKIMDMMRKSNYLLKANRGKTWNIGYVLSACINLNNSFYSRV